VWDYLSRSLRMLAPARCNTDGLMMDGDAKSRRDGSQGR
jgi:hypothetical protein